MSSRILLRFGAAAAVLLAAGAGAATRHVAPDGDDAAGDGSDSRPWRTISKAVAEARPGDDVEIRAGVYRESVVFPRSGAPEARITVRARAGDAPVLDGADPVDGWVRCAPDEPGLTRAGVRHPAAARIFRMRVPRALAAGGLILYEGRDRCLEARWPDQARGVGLDTDRLWPLKADAFGRGDRLPDPARADPDAPGNPWPALTRALPEAALSEYWRGATATVWLRRDGNYTQIKRIADREDGALRFDSALRRALQAGDRYALGGHPHALSIPGEFYVERANDGAETVALYYWPRDEAALAGGMAAAARPRGFFGLHRGHLTIEGNAVRESAGTCISFYGMHRSRIVGNRIYGAVGVHANGSSCYLGCTDILVARNLYYNGANATFQNIRNFTLFANVWDGGGREEGLVAVWPNSRNHTQPTGGHLVLLHNTIVNAGRNIAAIFRYETFHAHNNLIGGSASWSALQHHSHNGWIGRFTDQANDRGWNPGDGGWQLPEGRPGSPTREQFAAVFRNALDGDAERRDYRLAGRPGANPAIHAGCDAREILRAAGVLDAFPDFDFEKDLAGRAWAARPSMGAYEYEADPAPPASTRAPGAIPWAGRLTSIFPAPTGAARRWPRRPTAPRP